MNNIICSHPLVIIGAGAAGIYLIQRLGNSIDLLVLESGSRTTFDGNDYRNAVYVKGSYENGQVGRARGFGGTTNLWGGQLLPFTPHDLTPEKGWPLNFSDLQGHYEEVSQRLLGEDSSYGSQVAARSRWPLPSIQHSDLVVHFSKWLANPRFRSSLAYPMPSRAGVKCESTLDSIEPLPCGSYLLHCLRPDGKSYTIKAEQVVLAAGTIETIRILQASRSRYGLPVAEALGSGFMDHVSADITSLRPRSRWKMQRWFNTRRCRGGNRYSVRISASRHSLETLGRLNASAMILVRQPRYLWQKVINSVVASFTSLAQGFVFKPFGELVLNCMVEQHAYMPGAKISLTTDGLPSINWEASKEEAEAALVLAQLVVDALWRDGWLSVSPVLPTADKVLSELRDVCHPMGGAAMNNDASRAVVTSDCELLHCPGIWLCSAAVFPSGSHSNPTMTILALADRLANVLMKKRSNYICAS